MLRAARANPGSISAPSMIRALVSSSLPKRSLRPLVLPSEASAFSSTTISPALALADRACRSASARTFFGNSIAWLRGLGPNTLPPPRHCGTDLSP